MVQYLCFVWLKSDETYIKIKINVSQEINDPIVLAPPPQEVLKVLKTNRT